MKKRESTNLIQMAARLFDASPEIKHIRRLALLGALEVVTDVDGIECIQLVRDESRSASVNGSKPTIAL